MRATGAYGKRSEKAHKRLRKAARKVHIRVIIKVSEHLTISCTWAPMRATDAYDKGSVLTENLKGSEQGQIMLRKGSVVRCLTSLLVAPVVQ